jgi:hypothetical protein
MGCYRSCLNFSTVSPASRNETAHRVFVDRVVARNREKATPVAHHDVFTLIDDFETGLFQRSNSTKMVDARELRHDYI